MEYIPRGGATSRPSDYGEGFQRRETKPVIPNGKYKFRRYIRRITYEREINLLFDNPVKPKHGRYDGEIGGIEARINFSPNPNTPCLVSAKTKEDLKKVYDEISKRLH